ncbi:hypothetical protein BASA60_005384 [Batrachochytrium salamandrivorans]|nr:hypothetical protein BASA60_005384 [Batrachochytrium salamandrivorans]
MQVGRGDSEDGYQYSEPTKEEQGGDSNDDGTDEDPACSSMLLELNSLQKNILKLSDDFYSRMSISPDLKKQGGEFES